MDNKMIWNMISKFLSQLHKELLRTVERAFVRFDIETFCII